MEVHSFANLSSQGEQALPKGAWIAAAIHPTSELDLCTVGGRRLGTRSFVPVGAGEKVAPIRGFRSASDLSNLQDQTRLGETLTLILFEAGDDIEIPAARAPLVREVQIDNSTIGTTQAGATLALRLPCSGRASAALYFQSTQITQNVFIVIRGIRFHAFEAIKSPSVLQYRPFTDEIYDDMWGGAGAQPQSVITPGNYNLGRTIYLGGNGDLDEAYDEFEVYVWGVQTAGTLFVHGEVYGERCN